MAHLICQPIPGIWRNTSATNAPSTRPAGQPACRMFSQCVLFFGNSEAVSGLMTASQVPLANEKDNAPIEETVEGPIFATAGSVVEGIGGRQCRVPRPGHAG